MQMRGEDPTALHHGEALQHLGGDVGPLEGAGGGQGFVQQHQTVLVHLLEDGGETGAFLAQTPLVDGVLAARGEVGEDLVAGGDDAGVRADGKAQLRHDEGDAHRAGDDRFSAAVRTGQDVDHALLVKDEVVRHYRRVQLHGDDGIAQSFRVEGFFRNGPDLGMTERTAPLLQLHQKLRGFGDELDLRHHPDEEVRVLQNVMLNDLLPGADGRAEHIPDGAVEGILQGHLLVVALPLPEGNERRYAGLVVVLEVQPEHLVKELSGLEGLVVDGKNPRPVRPELRVQIHADGDGLDLPHPGRQGLQLRVQIAVVFRSGQRVDPLREPHERLRFQLRRQGQQLVPQQVEERRVELHLRDAVEIRLRGLGGVGPHAPQLRDVVQKRDHLQKDPRQLGVVGQVLEGVLPVEDHLRIAGVEGAEVAALQIHQKI